MRKIYLYFLAIAVVLVGAWMFTNQDKFSGIVQQYVENGEFITLKARYTPAQIMKDHQDELLADNKHAYQEPGLKYHPYLLMEVKYSQADKKSREGMVLWSLVDGEMVIQTETWEKTHGFEDAINAEATRNDFKIMQALAKRKGGMTFDQLQKELHLEKESLKLWVESGLSKHLIIQKDNELQLHFQDPKILISPETQINEWFVKKPYSHTQRLSNLYSNAQVQKVAKAAFGDDFTVRSATEVFLPVYSIEVLNPDGSIFTSYWNAINGERIIPRYTSHRW